MFPPKHKWRMVQQRDPERYREDWGASNGEWRKNYASAEKLLPSLKKVILDQLKRCQFLALSEAEARARYPIPGELIVASLGGVSKGKIDPEDGLEEARVVHDGTNTVFLNTKICVRDGSMFPMAKDIKRGWHHAVMQVTTCQVSHDRWGIPTPTTMHLHGGVSGDTAFFLGGASPPACTTRCLLFQYYFGSLV